jgi:DNA replication and repair protein RecF
LLEDARWRWLRSMLRTLKLSQFRCFDSLRLEVGPGLTAFIGENAQGKTSILEAVCVLLRLQSPRTTSLNDLIRFDQTGFGLSGTWGDQSLGMVNEVRRRRKLYHGENLIDRSREYLEHSGLVVWMGNDDLGLITGSGSRRRRYLDFQASQLYPDYRVALRSYEVALRSRNELLKEMRPDWAQIDAYTSILLAHGNQLTRQRQGLVDSLNEPICEAQQAISGSSEVLSIDYLPGAGEDFAETLSSMRDRDQRRGQTNAGPHRDEVGVLINDRPASKFASEGQQRTIALALKLGQMELLRKRRDQTPILLVDDVFGELDPKRRDALMQALPRESQKLVTTTSLKWLPNEEGLQAAIFDVSEGKARPRGPL